MSHGSREPGSWFIYIIGITYPKNSKFQIAKFKIFCLSMHLNTYSRRILEPQNSSENWSGSESEFHGPPYHFFVTKPSTFHSPKHRALLQNMPLAAAVDLRSPCYRARFRPQWFAFGTLLQSSSWVYSDGPLFRSTCWLRSLGYRAWLRSQWVAFEFQQFSVVTWW